MIFRLVAPLLAWFFCLVGREARREVARREARYDREIAGRRLDREKHREACAAEAAKMAALKAKFDRIREDELAARAAGDKRAPEDNPFRT